MMLAREMGEARRVKQIAVQLIVEAMVVAGMIVVVVRIVLVVVERKGMAGVAGPVVVGAGDVGGIVLEEEIDGRLELATLDSTVVRCQCGSRQYTRGRKGDRRRSRCDDRSRGG